MPSMWCRALDLKLIQLVKENQLLYNTSHPKYTDTDKREVTWQKIGDILNRPAITFAGIQCQIHFGDFQEDKHKPGFIENLKEYLPEQYCSSWGAEKKILKEYRKHQGLSSIEAKHLYTKTARELPTYGVTFFLVKEQQKDKKKLIPRLLGISAESILRLDEVSKEILQQWPLTHVKTYHAGKGETFTLNFGDYSDKEYCVKTRDAYRIRDVLEGYIDLIRRRMLADYSARGDEHGAVGHDNVSEGTANVIQHVPNSPMKIIDHSFVGPSRIVAYEPGKSANQGTQIVTVQQVIKQARGGETQQAVKSEVPVVGNRQFVRRLNRCNSNAVKIVTLLTDPSDSNIDDARSIVTELNNEMANIRDGIKEAIDKQNNEEEKRKLEEQLERLQKLLQTLTDCTDPNSFDLNESMEAAKETADLTTQMYLSLDDRTKRNSRVIKRSHKSFMEDEATEQNIRRGSLIAAAANAMHTLEALQLVITKSYSGPKVDAEKTKETEKQACDKLARLSAALAHYILAHSDPKNIDYSSAVNSMNTIHEVTPELVNDIQVISSEMDGNNRKHLQDDMKSMFDAIAKLSSAVGTEDTQKITDASDNFSKSSGKLLYVLGKRIKDKEDKEKEVHDLARAVESCSSDLTSAVRGLLGSAGADGNVDKVNAALAQVDAATEHFMTQAKLTTPTIHEAHCRSAATAASVALSSSAALLASTCAPLLHEDTLHHQINKLNEALERYRQSYEGLNEDDDVFKTTKEAQRMKFITSMSHAKKTIGDAHGILDEPSQATSPSESKLAEARLSDRLAQLNATIASLLLATADKDHPDYKSAELAVSTIAEVMPLLVQDAKLATANKSEAEWADMMSQVKAMCDALRQLCDGNAQDEKDALAKFSDASGKMVYVVSRRVNPDKEQQIIGLSSQACGCASQLLAGVQQLCTSVGGDRGDQLDLRGAAVADAAQTMLTVAQMNAPSISDRRCQTALLSSIEKVSSCADQLSHAWEPLLDVPQHEKQASALQQAKYQLDDYLNKLRKACEYIEPKVVENPHSPKEQNRMRFMTTVSKAKEQMRDAKQELNASPPPLTPEQAEVAKKLLAHRLALLNAAIASLLMATSVSENPDYESAEQAVNKINELMPQIAQDAVAANACVDNVNGGDILREVGILCDAASKLCEATHGQDASEAAAQFADASTNITHLSSANNNQYREQQIVDLSSAACGTASLLLADVQRLCVGVGGVMGDRLDEKGAAVADAAQTMLNTARVTAASISSPECRSALMEAVDGVSSKVQLLAGTWSPLKEQPQHKDQVLDLDQGQMQLEELLDKLRQAVLLPDTATPTSIKPVVPPPKKPAVPTRTSSSSAPRKPADWTQEFLHRVRCEESQNGFHSPSEVQQKSDLKICVSVKTDDEKRIHQEFVNSAEEAQQKMLAIEEELKKMTDNKVKTPPISATEAIRAQERVQNNLALLGLEVANLVSANYADKIDYSAASKSTAKMPHILNEVVQDSIKLSGTLGSDTLLSDAQQLCHSARDVCHAAVSDAQKLNENAVAFGDKSTKILYAIKADVNHDLEKEIIVRAKAIGDRASSLAVEVGGVVSGAGGGDSIKDVCASGAACVDSAGKLLYTAKLVAPAIHEVPCQEALVSSADTLTKHLESFTQSWKPFIQDPQKKNSIRHLEKEAENLHRIVAGLRDDVKSGRLGKKSEERLVVEDTPMKQLALKIIDNAKLLSSCAESPSLRSEYSSQVSQLQAALTPLDLAYARCSRTPHDINNRRALDSCVQALQMAVLSSRPRARTHAQTHVIDLRDFIDEVSSEAKKLSEVARQTDVATEHDKKILQDICMKCTKMSSDAYQLTHTDDAHFDSTYCDILDVDCFGKNCDDLISEIERSLKGIEDQKARKMMYSNLLPLTESCHIMRFTTKNGISSTKCAALESAVEQLEELETRGIKVLVGDADVGDATLRRGPPSRPRPPAALLALSDVCAAPRELTSYVAECASHIHTQDDKDKLLKHLYKLVDLVRAATLLAANRESTWHTAPSPQYATIRQRIIQELNNPESGYGLEDTKPGSGNKCKLLEDEDIVALLGTGRERKEGSHSSPSSVSPTAILECSRRVISATETLVPPPALTPPAARNAAHAATQLANIIRANKQQDEALNNKIEEDVQEMTFITYNVIKAAEHATQDPNNTNYKRRLQETLRALNDAVRKLVSSAPGMDHRSQCAALGLNLRPNTMTTPTMPYGQTTDAILQQQEVIYRLKSDDTMAASEFRSTLDRVTSAVATSTHYASQCAYLLSISELDKSIASEGVVDGGRIERAVRRLQDTTLAVIGATHVHRAKEESADLKSRIGEFSQVLDEAQTLVKDPEAKRSLALVKSEVVKEAGQLQKALDDGDDMNKILVNSVNLLKELNIAQTAVEKCPLLPTPGKLSPSTKEKCDDIAKHSQILVEKTLSLVNAVSEVEDLETMTWVTFSSSRNKLIDAYDALVKAIRINGQRAGVLEGSVEDEAEEPEACKGYLEAQVELANKWLTKPNAKAEVKQVGQEAVNNVIEVGRKMVDELNVSEGEDLRQLIMETEELMKQCAGKYDAEKYSVLSDRLKELRKLVERGVVTRVVEDFIDAEEPLQDLDIIADTHTDPSKRKYILESKIAELLAQLGRMRTTARLVATTTGKQHVSVELQQCTEKADLLAPLLVKAAEERIHTKDQEAISRYQKLLEEYTQSISRVRELCDSSVEPMEFVQTASETMQRLREESTEQTDPKKCAHTSQAIMRLANRSIDVSVAVAGTRDAELLAALRAARQRLHQAAPHGLRTSRVADWKHTTAQILRTTGEVESALGGENIFKREPTESNDQIFSEALKLHECVREWSSRDNAVVGAARRMAVLMANLAQHMHQDNKSALISTSKSIVSEAREVAVLARRLALECTDIRIRNNLLQTCDRIPTISGQLKMLITVKGSSLGHQASEDDQAAMDMLVGNAQSLMISVQEVVKVAAGASVKIMSQRGPRLKWVRKTYY